MADLATLIENVVSIKKHIDVYAAVPRLNPKQTAALRTNLGLLGQDLAALAAYVAPSPSRAAATDEPEADVPAEWFIDVEDGSAISIVGGSPNNPNGATFTLGDAVRWWTYVFGLGLNISHVRPTLLPGSRVLSPEGYADAVALAAGSANFAPEDFNPLGLEVIA